MGGKKKGKKGGNKKEKNQAPPLPSTPLPPNAEAVPRPPAEEGLARKGRPCKLKANHFLLEFSVLYKTKVSVTPEDLEDRDVVVMKLLDTDTYRGKCIYDGQHMYSGSPLESIDIDIDIDDRKFNVLFHDEQKVTQQQENASQTLETVFHEMSKIVLRDEHSSSRINLVTIGKSVYSRFTECLSGPVALSEGIHQNVRPTQSGLSLIIDTSFTALTVQCTVKSFVNKFLGRKDESLVPLSSAEHVMVQNALRGIKVEVILPRIHGKHIISGLTPEATQDYSITFMGKSMHLTDYYKKVFKYDINLMLPCLQVVCGKALHYLPMDICEIVPGQPYSDRLNEGQRNELLLFSCQKPYVYEGRINQIAHQYMERAKQLGILITRIPVYARVFCPPKLLCGDNQPFCPEEGNWENKKMLDPKTIKNWICVNFAHDLPNADALKLCKELAAKCSAYGMTFTESPAIPVLHGDAHKPEFSMDFIFNKQAKFRLKGQEIDLVLLILPNLNNALLYGKLKCICDTNLGVVSQCILSEFAADHNPYRKDRTLANLSLQINVKAGGKNIALHDFCVPGLPKRTDKCTIIFGADVIHPHPGEISSPYIAAVVASQDWPQVAKYAGLVSAQVPKKDRIQDSGTGGMIKDLLELFIKQNNVKPERIIFYSEGQICQASFESELSAIYEACASLKIHNPSVTYIAVQKKHHTRLFPEDPDDDGNIEFGTVVDSIICHPTQFDFYLCSHAVDMKETSRPTKYHVLCYDDDFTPDDLQTLTNDLCYTYARCTSSVSLVPPVYYAHLLGERARLYVDVDGCGGEAPPDAEVRPLLAVNEKLKNSMFYI